MPKPKPVRENKLHSCCHGDPKAVCAALAHFFAIAMGEEGPAKGSTDTDTIWHATLALDDFSCWDYHGDLQYYVKAVHGMGEIILHIWDTDDPDRSEDAMIGVACTGYTLDC